MWVSKCRQAGLVVKWKYMIRSFKPAIIQTTPLHQDDLSMRLDLKSNPKHFRNKNIFTQGDVTQEYFTKFKEVVNKTERNMRRRQNILNSRRSGHFDENKVDEYLQQDRESDVKSIFVDLIDRKEIEEAEQKLREFMDQQNNDEKQQDSAYLERFHRLIQALGVKDEQQLIKIHGDCLAREKSTEFAEKAKALILRQIVEIVQKQRNNVEQEKDDKRLLDKLLYNPNSNSEFVMSEIQGINDHMELESYLSDKIDRNSIQKVSEQLAKEELEEQAEKFGEHKKQVDMKQSEMMGVTDTRYTYLGKDNLFEIDPMYDPDMTFDDSNEFKYEYGMKQMEMTGRVREYSDEQQQIYQIYQRISKKYFKEKAEILAREVMSKGIIRMNGMENEDQEFKEIRHDYYKEFGIAEDQLQGNTNVIREYKQPSMLEIYDSIDYLVEGIHQNDFIKAKMRRDDLCRNTEFRPTFSHLNLQGDELLWSQFKETFDTINNREYVRDDFEDMEYIEQYEELCEELEDSNNPQYMRFALDRADKLYVDEVFAKDCDPNEIQSQDENNEGYLQKQHGDNEDVNQDSEESEEIMRGRFNFSSNETIFNGAGMYDNNEKMEGQDTQTVHLPYQDQYELEVYRQIKKDQFFKHHLQQDLQYYSERNDRLKHKINQNYLEQYRSDRLYQIEQQKYDKIFNIYQKKQNMGDKASQKKQRQGQGRGRRKTSSASVVVRDGYGRVKINGKPFLQYFPDELLRAKCLIPIEVTGLAGLVDIQISVKSGGFKGQVEAIQQGLARAISDYDPSLRPIIRLAGLLYTDSRQVERKKQGRYKARKSYTYVRR